MLHAWVVIAVALAYIGLLFVVASYGDRTASRRRERGAGKFIYPLSLAVYCTSWTFFGSVGLATHGGFEFLTIYVGPVLLIGLGYPFVIRVMRLAKAHNITSIADFIAARYGKSQVVAALVALIAIVGTVPYVALQLKAVSNSLAVILPFGEAQAGGMSPIFGDLSLLVAFSLALFAILFGTRHADATEHQEGLMLAIATESIVKLVCFLAVGIFVTFWMFDGPGALVSRALKHASTTAVLTGVPPLGTLVAQTLLSFAAIMLLPRQFHVTIVESHGEAHVRRAAWLFPLYLLLINLFVIPIALAGMLVFFNTGADGDMFVLALPIAAGSSTMTLVAFVGGLSAATAMVIVESVALSIMVSNDLVMPLALKRRGALVTGTADLSAFLLRTRRIAILVILALTYVYHRFAGEAQLAAIGLLSFAAIAQLAPAFFIGLLWPRGTARGAIAGMTIGILTWAYTLLLPSFADAGLFSAHIVRHGAFDLAWLRPQALFGLDLPPLVHGTFWSLALNVCAYFGFSLARAPSPIERVQARVFVPTDLAPATPSLRLWGSSVAVAELTATVSRYIGEERTRSSFEQFAALRRVSLVPSHEADIHLLRHAEHLLASAIGAASSRLVLSLLLRKRTVSIEAAFNLLDEASAAIHYNREILQTALDHVRQGIAVFDPALQLICWNRRFGELLDLPPERVRFGSALNDILLGVADAAGMTADAREAFARERLSRYARALPPFHERFDARGIVVEVRPTRMPDGGIVATFTDITASVETAEALERRVAERTEELTQLNAALAHAKAEADDANLSKTRFLAAAGHDILQPLNAARLYVTSLMERQGEREDARLAANIDASLEAVEDILNALLDISRLDAGAMKPELTEFSIGDVLRQLELEFAPVARAKGLALTFVPSTLAVRSDRRMLRRLLQNLVSNAIKYTPRGRVLVGCRRHGDAIRIGVCDTGIGVAPSQQRAIFQEFHRLDEGARVARGLGLGLSIVERLARILGHAVKVESAVGRGSIFWLEAPAAAARTQDAPPARTAGKAAGFEAMTVLCIDNEPTILDGMQMLLGGWGCHVIVAADLAGACEALDRSARAPCGLLVDYHLDVGDGIAAIVALRQRCGPELPAILLTADRGPQVHQAAQAYGIAVVNKPVKPAALRAVLAQWRVRQMAAAE